MPTLEQQIRPCIETFVENLKRLVIETVEEAVLHGDGLDSLVPLKAKPRKKARKAKPQRVVDLPSSPSLAKVVKAVTASRSPQNSHGLAEKLGLGETTVRDHLKRLLAAGIVNQSKSEGRFFYTWTGRKVTLSR